ncbi:MAG TPA: hypothetical protein VE817_01825 [Candidatus Acidoferrum sp.]|nr:hypothetical protein [Candidatus Acidoferrum sp.]
MDAALAPPAEPATPGLLDLLTVGPLGGAPLGGAPVDDPEPNGGPSAAPSAGPRFAVNASSRGSTRLWVEVEAARR